MIGLNEKLIGGEIANTVCRGKKVSRLPQCEASAKKSDPTWRFLVATQDFGYPSENAHSEILECTDGLAPL